MAVIAFIEAEDVIEKILKHLGLWEPKPRPPPRLDTQRDFPYTPPHLKATSYHLTEKGNALMSDIRACWKDLYRGYCAIFGEQEANRVNDLIAKTNHTR
jgi:hypothetical protein